MVAQFLGLPECVVYRVVGTCWVLIFLQTVITVTNSKALEKACSVSSGRNRGAEIPALDIHVRDLAGRNRWHNYSHFDLATKRHSAPSSAVQ